MEKSEAALIEVEWRVCRTPACSTPLCSWNNSAESPSFTECSLIASLLHCFLFQEMSTLSPTARSRDLQQHNQEHILSDS